MRPASPDTEASQECCAGVERASTIEGLRAPGHASWRQTAVTNRWQRSADQCHEHRIRLSREETRILPGTGGSRLSAPRRPPTGQRRASATSARRIEAAGSLAITDVRIEGVARRISASLWRRGPPEAESRVAANAAIARSLVRNAARAPGAVLILLLGRPMRQQEAANVPHRQRNLLRSVFPGVNAQLPLGREHRARSRRPGNAPRCRPAEPEPAFDKPSRSRASR